MMDDLADDLNLIPMPLRQYAQQGAIRLHDDSLRLGVGWMYHAVPIAEAVVVSHLAKTHRRAFPLRSDAKTPGETRGSV